MISDLQTENWAVLSERGCEATQLSHEEARRLVHKLASEGRHGLCIVTNQAAERIENKITEKRDLVASR
jgi:vacuolar-type H+-ATPase subunit F/Vma7